MADPDTRFKMGTLCRLTGLKPELLRAWQRRFQLFEPERTDGGHRMYTPDDLQIALHVRALVEAGQSIGEIARKGRAALLTEARASVPDPLGGRPADIAAIRPPLTPVDLEALADRVVASAVALQPEELAAALDEGVARATPEQLVAQLVEPASHRIGALWQEGACSVAGEHLASAMMRDRIAALVRAGAPAAGGTAPEAVIACAPDDRHENGSLVTALRLTEIGWRVTFLGAATPIPDLDKICRTRRPHAVYVSCTLPDCFAGARDAFLGFARRWRGAFELVIGGQGVPAEDAELTELGVRLSAGWTPPAPPAGWSAA